MIRTLNAATPSKSRVVGASIVQRGIARSFLPGSGSRSAHHIPAGDAERPAGRPAVKLVLIRYVALLESQDVSRVPLVTSSSSPGGGTEAPYSTSPSAAIPG